MRRDCFRLVLFFSWICLIPLVGHAQTADSPSGGASTSFAADTAMFKTQLQDPRFAQAWTAYTNRQFQLAYDLFSKLIRERTGDDAVDFAYALAARQVGKPSHAAMAFDRILLRNPGNQRARVELGRIYFDIKQYGLAREAFMEALKSNPPSPVRDNIERYLSQINSQERRWQISGLIGIGGLYDDNVNVGPDASVVAIAPIQAGTIPVTELEVDQDSKPLDAWGLSASAALGLSWDFGEPNGWSSLAGATYYQNWLDDAYDYEIEAYDVLAGLREAGSTHLFTAPVHAQRITRGHDALADIAGFNPFLIWALSPNLHLISSATAEYRDYLELDERDAGVLALGQSVRRYFTRNNHSVSAGVQLFTEDAEEAIYDNEGFALTLGGELRPAANTILFVQGLYRYSDYAERETLAPEKRQDDQVQFISGLRQRIGSGLFINASWQWTDNQSTFDLYEYNRNVVALSSTWTF